MINAFTDLTIEKEVIEYESLKENSCKISTMTSPHFFENLNENDIKNEIKGCFPEKKISNEKKIKPMKKSKTTLRHANKTLRRLNEISSSKDRHDMKTTAVKSPLIEKLNTIKMNFTNANGSIIEKIRLKEINNKYKYSFPKNIVNFYKQYTKELEKGNVKHLSLKEKYLQRRILKEDVDNSIDFMNNKIKHLTFINQSSPHIKTQKGILKVSTMKDLTETKTSTNDDTRNFTNFHTSYFNHNKQGVQSKLWNDKENDLEFSKVNSTIERNNSKIENLKKQIKNLKGPSLKSKTDLKQFIRTDFIVQPLKIVHQHYTPRMFGSVKSKIKNQIDWTEKEKKFKSNLKGYDIINTCNESVTFLKDQLKESYVQLQTERSDFVTTKTKIIDKRLKWEKKLNDQIHMEVKDYMQNLGTFIYSDKQGYHIGNANHLGRDELKKKSHNVNKKIK